MVGSHIAQNFEKIPNLKDHEVQARVDAWVQADRLKPLQLPFDGELCALRRAPSKPVAAHLGPSLAKPTSYEKSRYVRGFNDTKRLVDELCTWAQVQRKAAEMNSAAAPQTSPQIAADKRYHGDNAADAFKKSRSKSTDDDAVAARVRAWLQVEAVRPYDYLIDADVRALGRGQQLDLSPGRVSHVQAHAARIADEVSTWAAVKREADAAWAQQCACGDGQVSSESNGSTCPSTPRPSDEARPSPSNSGSPAEKQLQQQQFAAVARNSLSLHAGHSTSLSFDWPAAASTANCLHWSVKVLSDLTLDVEIYILIGHIEGQCEAQKIMVQKRTRGGTFVGSLSLSPAKGMVNRRPVSLRIPGSMMSDLQHCRATVCFDFSNHFSWTNAKEFEISTVFM
jgi:hypothetical protein